jgi:hypothetical protein
VTPAQFHQLVVSWGATYKTTRDGVEWWRLPNGEWLGKRQLPNGLLDVRRFPANACGC